MKLTELFDTPEFYKPGIKRPYIIAEAGVNHEGSMDTAKRLIYEAKEGGADAIKFQTYKAETIASKHSPAYWDTTKESITSQFELFKKHDKFWKNEFEALKKYCDEVDIEFMSTPFDAESAEFLNDMMDVFKISSSDLTNYPFIEQILRYGKPIVLSTGASEMWELHKVVEMITKHTDKLALLHCILNYPTENKNANLGMISDIQLHFPKQIIGYSDHTLPGDMDVLITATLLGSKIIEKHFSHDKKLPGNDHYHAMDKNDLKRFWEKWGQIEETLGSFTKYSLESEQISKLNARRSLVADVDIKEGEVIKKDYLTWKRPAYGVSPQFIDDVIGKTAMRDIERDEVIYFNMLQ